MSTVTCKTIAHGQPRPYADHEYINELIFSQDDYHTNVPPGTQVPWYVDREQALKFARLFCPYIETDDPDYNWASRILIAFDRIEPTPHGNPTLGFVRDDCSDKWRIHVRAAFTD